MALDLTTPENQAELAKLIQSETDKVRTKYSGELKGVQDELAKLKLGQMSTEQQASFLAQQKEADLLARESALKTKELDLGTKELLASKGLKPELSALLTADTIEGRTAQLDVLVKAMNLQVKDVVTQKIGQDDPDHTNVNNEGKLKQYDFSKMTYAERVELYQKDQKLYEQLANRK
jgi:hypothetical protein